IRDSAKGRTLNPYTYEDYIQTDAAVNPGNSGGPLVDLDGRLIGVMTAIKSRSGGFQGVGLAVSSNLARKIAEELREKGQVRRGYLGLLVEDLDPDERERLGTAGVTVADVVAGSPAEQAALQRGDVIVQVAGHAIATAGDLQKLVSFTQPGTRISLEVIRDGRKLSVPVTLSELPSEVRLPGKQP
ncbi:MAG: PDZ domain-containing protein, partial [Gemmataceae bacterium]|nr:PDZ domain-containing protein [Gemmataceae bacterium]